MVVSTSVATESKLKFDDVEATLLSEDMRRKNQEPSSGDALTVVSTSNRGRRKDRGKNNNIRKSKSTRRPKSKGKNEEC